MKICTAWLQKGSSAGLLDAYLAARPSESEPRMPLGRLARLPLAH